MTILYSLSSTDPTFNLALEELLARQATEPVFMLWQNAPSVIVGCHQNTAAEIDEAFVASRGIQVVRRITGGGAVYHDLGNVNYSCISLEREWGPASAATFVSPVVLALQQLGIQAEFSGRNDILANGRKVSGCARSVPKDHTLFHGTLLFDTDLDILSLALKPDPEKILSKGIKSVRARVGNLKEMLPPERQNMTMAEFLESLKQTAVEHFGAQAFDEVPEALRQGAEALAASKYRTWEWNFGSHLDYEVHNRIHCGAGTVHAEFNVRQNRIADLRFTGDFFGTHPIEGLVEHIVGQCPRRQSMETFLNTLPIHEWIGGITAAELAELVSIAS